MDKYPIKVKLLSDVLIAFGTRYGATGDTAAAIAAVLKKKHKLVSDIWDLKDYRSCPDLSDYQYVIIGSGIKYGKWTENTEKYLENDFTGKKVAVYISSSYAGETETYDYAKKNFLENVVAKHSNVNPIATEAFGGRIPLTQIPKIWTLRILQRIPTFQKDNRDWEKIEKWAERVGKLFTEEN